VHFIINGKYFDTRSYLTSRIYPHQATLAKSISWPQLTKQKLFVAHQEFARKDVESAFEFFKHDLRKSDAQLIFERSERWENMKVSQGDC